MRVSVASGIKHKSHIIGRCISVAFVRDYSLNIRNYSLREKFDFNQEARTNVDGISWLSPQKNKSSQKGSACECRWHQLACASRVASASSPGSQTIDPCDFFIFFPDESGPMGLIRDVSGGGVHMHSKTQEGGMDIEGGREQMQDMNGKRSQSVPSIVIFLKKIEIY